MQASVARYRVARQVAWMLPGLLIGGYVAVRRAGMAVLYKPAFLNDEQVRRDLCYREESNDEKHRLDLFLPAGRQWPILAWARNC